MARPTVGDAKNRAIVMIEGRGWQGEVFYINERRQRAKVRLSSGSVLVLPVEDLAVVRVDQAPLIPVDDRSADDTQRHPEAG